MRRRLLWIAPILLTLLWPLLGRAANDFWTHGSFPSAGSPATSASMRAELDAISAGFDKLPGLTGNGNKVVLVNGGGTALTVGQQLIMGGNLTISGAYATTITVTGTTTVTLPTSGTLATLDGTESLSNKTLVAPIFSGVSTLGGNRFFHTSGTNNTFFGVLAGTTGLTGGTNAGFGAGALGALTSGGANTAVGYNAGNALTTGASNVAIGTRALGANQTRNASVAIGEDALGLWAPAYSITPNVIIGEQAVPLATGATSGADGLVGVGDRVMHDLTTGYSQVALGDSALEKVTSGFKNTCVGSRACASGVVTGDNNSAFGRTAMIGLTGGQNNTCAGANCLYQLTSGTGNAAVGVDAGGGAGGNAVTTGTNMTFLGYGAKPGSATQRTNSAAIGYNATVDADNTMQFGNASVTSFCFGSQACIAAIASQASVNAVWTTGDVKLTIKTTADPGWVLMNDGTIGNAASGGTTRANADTSDLFTLLWTNCANAQCAVSSGRGASAAADFAANKTIALPKSLGRALAVYGSGSGLTARAMGETVGEETHALSIGEMPAHDHGISGKYTMDAGGNTNTVGGSGPIASSVTAAASQGSGTAHNVMQPTVFLNVMIKL